MKTLKALVILIVTILCSTASSSLANQIETNKLMRYAAELSKSGKNEEALKVLIDKSHKETYNLYSYHILGMVQNVQQE